MVRAEVGEQQEAAVEVLREDRGRVHAGVGQQRGNVHERAAILLRRRRVHRDQRRAPARARGVGERDAEIAAKARVGGRGRER